MMPFRFTALTLLLAATACAPSAKSPDMIRANARAAVAVAKSTYVLVGDACLEASQLPSGAAIAMKCADYLDPAYNLILDAALAVDTNWTASAACDLVQAVTLVGKAAMTLGPSSSVAPAAKDAVLLATQLSGAVCPVASTDAGVE